MNIKNFINLNLVLKFKFEIKYVYVQSAQSIYLSYQYKILYDKNISNIKKFRNFNIKPNHANIYFPNSVPIEVAL